MVIVHNTTTSTKRYEALDVPRGITTAPGAICVPAGTSDKRSSGIARSLDSGTTDSRTAADAADTAA